MIPLNRRPRVVISILNCNGWEDTLECLESVRRLDYPNYLAVVVDNGSWNDSADKIKAWAEANLGPGHVIADYTRETALAGGDAEVEKALNVAASSARMVLIRNEDNLGFTGGNNVSIHYALRRGTPAEYVFLLNNDARPEHDCLGHLVSAMQVKSVGIAGALILDCLTGEVVHLAPDKEDALLGEFFSPFISNPTPDVERKGTCWTSFWACGAAVLIRADLLRYVHKAAGRYLDERLYLYGDEMEFSHVARSVGYLTVTVKPARVYHEDSSSSGGAKNPLVWYYRTRNSVLLAQRLLPVRWRLLFHPVNTALSMFRTARKLLQGQSGIAFAIASGTADGYRGVTGRWKKHDSVVKNLLASRRVAALAEPSPTAKPECQRGAAK